MKYRASLGPFLMIAAFGLSVSGAQAQVAGQKRCNAKGEYETYSCTGSGKLQSCKWVTKVGQKCTSSVKAPVSGQSSSKGVTTLPVAPKTSPVKPVKTETDQAKADNPDMTKDTSLTPELDRGETRSDALKATAPGKTPASKNELIDALTGPGGEASGPVLETGKNDKPGFDQGFRQNPDVGTGPVSGNPRNGLTQGGGLTGGLADSANRGSGVTSISQMGKGALSLDPKVKGSMAYGASTLQDPARGAGVKNYAVDEFGETWSFSDGSSYNRGFDGIREEITTKSGNETRTTAFIDGKVRAVRTETTNADGSVKTKTEAFDDKGKKTGETVVNTPPPETSPPADASQPDAGIPSEENSGFLRVKSAAELKQLQQAGAGRNGDIDPNEHEDGFSVPEGAIAPDATAVKNNLLGNPGSAGNKVRVVAPSGQNPFTSPNGGGAIDPTDDTVITVGGITEDPGDAFGDRGTTTPNLQGGRVVETSEDDEDDKESEN